jgi:hypothetical protein
LKILVKKKKAVVMKGKMDIGNEIVVNNNTISK